MTTEWTRSRGPVTETQKGPRSDSQSSIRAGDVVDVYGLQAEAQTAPSSYKAAHGVESTKILTWAEDVLTITTTDINRHSCTVKIIHANHL